MPDESRAFTMLTTGPLIYLICRPVYQFFVTQQSVFYFVSVLACINIVLFYFISRYFLKKNDSFWALAFYVFFPFRINYSRLLYPSVFVDFFFLIGVLILIYAIRKKKPLLFFPLGVLTSLLFAIHPYVYHILFGLVFSLVYLFFSKKKPVSNRKIILFSFFYFLGIFLALFSLNEVFSLFRSDYNYLRKLVVAKNAGVEVFCQTEIKSFFSNFFRAIIKSPFSIFRAVFVFLMIFFSLNRKVLARSPRLKYAVVSLVSSLGLFFVMVVLKQHVIRYRHFVWLCPGICLLMANSLSFFLEQKAKIIKNIFLIFSICFIALSFHESYLLTKETFRLTMVESWLNKKNIKYSSVLSGFQLFDSKNKKVSFFLPVYYDQDRAYIHWATVYKAYRAGLSKYLIPSGRGVYEKIYKDDPFLQNVNPVIEWIHPFSQFEKRIFPEGCVDDLTKEYYYIKVYNLDEVFSPGNFNRALSYQMLLRAMKEHLTMRDK
ncbi:MAG: glycosyltransferase family 39 protein [Candidatus Gastranaerophilales bacterium]|nr:glycosyltransferase family 39 protein [Candidatus Gastranaerophilales bacterium]